MKFTNPLLKTRTMNVTDKNSIIHFEFDISYYKDHGPRVIKVYPIKI